MLPPHHAGYNRCSRFDNRGHGQSSDDTDWTNFTWEGVSKDMQALADAELVDGARLVVGGASMGAGGALWLAATHPERVAALIMVRNPQSQPRFLPPGLCTYVLALEQLSFIMDVLDMWVPKQAVVYMHSPPFRGNELCCLIFRQALHKLV